MIVSVLDRGREDRGVLLDGAVAYADAGNHLVPVGERCTASHRAVPALLTRQRCGDDWLSWIWVVFVDVSTWAS